MEKYLDQDSLQPYTKLSGRNKMWNIRCIGDCYSMVLYECDNMELEEVQEYLLEKNCLEVEDYELYFTEEK